jgi:hypothetical protein
MTKITVTIDTKSNARLLHELLSALSFVKKVEAEEPYDDLNAEEIKMLESRWEDYLKNPGSAKSWADVKAKYLKKHGS